MVQFFFVKEKRKDEHCEQVQFPTLFDIMFKDLKERVWKLLNCPLCIMSDSVKCLTFLSPPSQSLMFSLLCLKTGQSQLLKVWKGKILATIESQVRVGNKQIFCPWKCSFKEVFYSPFFFWFCLLFASILLADIPKVTKKHQIKCCNARFWQIFM